MRGSQLLLVCLAVSTACLILSCSGDAEVGDPTRPLPTADETITPPDSGLTEFEATNPLRVRGRDKLRACVDTAGAESNLESVAGAVQEALLLASEDPRWPVVWGEPDVDIGCPIPPVALDSSRGTLGRRVPCLAQVSEYLVHVFVADPARLGDRFPEQTVEEATGVRKAGQESLLSQRGCEGSVSEAWYMAPGEWEDAELLQRFIYGEFGIFPVAAFR